MKILIRRKRDGQFLAGKDRWTSQFNEATDFDNTTKAQEFCQKHGLCDVEMVLKFRDKFPITLPCP
jgi:hypothetical protein